MKSLKHEVRGDIVKPIADTTRELITSNLFDDLSDLKWKKQGALTEVYWATKDEIEEYVNEIGS